MEFDINQALKFYLSDPLSVQTSEADSQLVDCENDPDALTLPLINGVLNPIVDQIANNPEELTRQSSFDSLQFLLKCGPTSPIVDRNVQEPNAELFRLSRSTPVLPLQSLSKILDLIVSGLSAEADIVHSEIESEEQDAVAHHKQLLEMYAFLLQWAISAVEIKAAEKSATAVPARRGGGKGAKSKAAAKDGSWDSTSQIQTAMDTMCKVFRLKLSKVFLTTSDRDTFVSLFTRSIYLILESEARVKTTSVRMFCFKVLCIAVKHHGHAFGLFRKKNVISVLADSID